MSALPAALTRRAPRPAPARRPDLRVVPRLRHTGRYLALIVVLGAAGVFGIVSLSALAAESAFAARALEGEIDDLSFRYDELTAEVAALESPGRVRDVAIGELGMVPATQPAYLVIDRPPAAAPADGGELAAEHMADPLQQALAAGE
jgi:hypothetical protein